MDLERQNKIYEKQWKIEREEKQKSFLEKIQLLNLNDEIECLSFGDSDSFQTKANEWPDKYGKKLYYQIELENSNEVLKLIKAYFKTIETDFIYIYLLNLNFGLVKISKLDFIPYWKDIVEIDGDEVFCHNPLNGEFILIEKTEDLIIGFEQQGKKWLYEITISNEVLMERIKNGI